MLCSDELSNRLEELVLGVSHSAVGSRAGSLEQSFSEETAHKLSLAAKLWMQEGRGVFLLYPAGRYSDMTWLAIQANLDSCSTGLLN